MNMYCECAMTHFVEGSIWHKAYDPGNILEDSRDVYWEHFNLETVQGIQQTLYISKPISDINTESYHRSQDDNIRLSSLLSKVQSRHYLRNDLLLVHFILYQWLTFVSL